MSRTFPKNNHICYFQHQHLCVFVLQYKYTLHSVFISILQCPNFFWKWDCTLYCSGELTFILEFPLYPSLQYKCWIDVKMGFIPQVQFLVSMRQVSECVWACVQGPSAELMPVIQWQKRWPVTHMFTQCENRFSDWLTPAAHWSAKGTMKEQNRKRSESADTSSCPQWHFTASLHTAAPVWQG